MSIRQKIKEKVILAPFTTFKIGGPAKFYIEIKSKDDLSDVFDWAKENKEKVFILSGGSNVLINDNGIDGLVIKIKNDDIALRCERLECGAGVVLSRAVNMASSSSLTGLEWAVGIPGSIGGAIRGNAGAFGSSIADKVETVNIFNAKKRKFEIFSNKDCKFNYRESIFKENHNFIIWKVILKLAKGNINEIKKLTAKYINHRASFQPKLPSAGCVFKNLDLSYIEECNKELADCIIEDGAVKEGKVGAGWIIDKVGLKGKTIGGAKVSLEHANFIVNTGNANSGEVTMLISYIKQQVRNILKIQLREEVQYLGF